MEFIRAHLNCHYLIKFNGIGSSRGILLGIFWGSFGMLLGFFWDSFWDSHSSVSENVNELGDQRWWNWKRGTPSGDVNRPTNQSKGGEKFGEKIPPHLHIGEERGAQGGGTVRTRNIPSPPPYSHRVWSKSTVVKTNWNSELCWANCALFPNIKISLTVK